MTKSRLEAFSDGVIAIILTIMVLDLKVPKEHSVDALAAMWPIYLAYTISYLNVFLVWLSHHDLFVTLKTIDRAVLTANGLLLFVASLIPFATAFAGEAHWKSAVAVATYGLVMIAVNLAFSYLLMAARRCAPDVVAAARYRQEARTSCLFASLFLAGTLTVFFAPRLALVVFTLTPLLIAAHRRRSAASVVSRA